MKFAKIWGEFLSSPVQVLGTVALTLLVAFIVLLYMINPLMIFFATGPIFVYLHMMRETK